MCLNIESSLAWLVISHYFRVILASICLYLYIEYFFINIHKLD